MIIRKIVESDKALIADWIAFDGDHGPKGMSPEFFFEPATLGLLFSDEIGPVFFVRLDPEPDHVIRVHIQFQLAHALRTVRMLKSGFAVVEERVRLAGGEKMIFDSISEPLIEFCVNRFGFQRIAGTNNLELELEKAHVR